MITSEHLGEIENDLEGGVSLESACALAGVPYRELLALVEEGSREDASEIARIAYLTVTRARALLERVAMRTILEAIKSGEYQPAQWVMRERVQRTPSPLAHEPSAPPTPWWGVLPPPRGG